MKKIKGSGKTTTSHHKRNDTPSPPEDQKPGLRKVWFLEAQGTTCPIEVAQQVKELWHLFDLDNNYYILKTSLQELIDIQKENKVKTKAIRQYILETTLGIDPNQTIIIHWRW